MGYGSNHDPKIMKEVAKLRCGKFRFIEKDQELDLAVANILGGVFAAIAFRVRIQVKAVEEGPLKGTTIVKSYGESITVNPYTGDHTVTVVQYRAGSQNSYVFELQLPAFDPTIPKEHYGSLSTLFEAHVEIEKLSMGDPLIISKRCQIMLLHPSDILKKELPDP